MPPNDKICRQRVHVPQGVESAILGLVISSIGNALLLKRSDRSESGMA